MSDDMSKTFNFVNIAAGAWTDVTDETVAADYEPQLTDEE